MKTTQSQITTKTIVDSISSLSRTMDEYRSVIHHYGNYSLYFAEMNIIRFIGDHPGALSIDLIQHFHFTSSACAQFVKKLRSKGFLYSEKSELDSRRYHLYLTEEGKKAYRAHLDNEEFWHSYCTNALVDCTEEEKAAFVKVMRIFRDAMQHGIKRDLYV